MQAVDARVERRLLAGLLDAEVDFALRFLDHFLDACRMDAAVLDELFERDARDLAAHRIEARQDDGFRRIVDDEVDARQRLERADVAALAADDAALHLIVRQCHDRHRRLGDMVGGAALDGDGEDVAGFLVRFVPRLLLVLLDLHGLLVLEFLFRLGHEDVLRFVGRETRDALELRLLLFMHLVDSLLRLVDAGFLARELLFLLFDGFELAVEVFLFLHDAAFLPRNLIPAFFRIAVELLAEAVDVLLRLEHELLLACFSFLFCIRNDLDRLGLGRTNLRFRTAFPGCITGACADDHCNDYR